ncbi:MAG: sigma-70 family RNA polymerase sigma factor [Planctomycetota bacterium]|nr:sigma-70 family RNA polymerase sigma factor [Planctomycetota bacterium]
MNDHRDDEIARGLRERKAEAWTALYEAYFDRIWRVTARLMGADAAAVADVVQETFLAAARSADAYDPARGPLWLWLAGIARNHVGAYRRARRRDNRVAKGGDLAPRVAERLTQWLENRHAPPPEVLATAEIVATVRAVLGKLNDDYQALLTARYCDGASVERLAQWRRCTPAAVRSKLARAREAFRETFTEKCDRVPPAPSGRKPD